MRIPPIVNPTIDLLFAEGDRVEKEGGDYKFSGVVVAIFVKRDGRTVRYVVEDDRGLLMIMNERQIIKPE